MISLKSQNYLVKQIKINCQSFERRKELETDIANRVAKNLSIINLCFKKFKANRFESIFGLLLCTFIINIYRVKRFTKVCSEPLK